MPVSTVQKRHAVMMPSGSRHISRNRQRLRQLFFTGIFHDEHVVAGRWQPASQLNRQLCPETPVNAPSAKTTRTLPVGAHSHRRRYTPPCQDGGGSPSQLGMGVADGCHLHSWHHFPRRRGRSQATDTCTADSCRHAPNPQKNSVIDFLNADTREYI